MPPSHNRSSALPKFSGNWRDYFRISSEYGHHVLSIEKTLDDIVATGSDGVELLMKAHRNARILSHQQGQDLSKITITPPLLGGSSFNASSPNIIHIDIDDAKKFTVTTKSGKNEYVSLTGVVVHEIFHAADVNLIKQANLTEEQSAALEKERKYNAAEFAVSSRNLTREQKLQVMEAYNNNSVFEKIERTSGLPLFMLLRINPEEHREEILEEIQKKTGIPSSLYKLRFFEKTFSEDYMIRSLNGNLLEKDATDYTDAFMAKHFPGEPWRGKYSNANQSPTMPFPVTRERGCGEVKLENYQPENASIHQLGTLSQPRINNEPSPFCGISPIKR